MARVVVPVTSLTPPKAALTTALAGTNNDLVFTAVTGGPGGNSIRIQYSVAGTSTLLSITRSGYDIIVNVATSGAGAAISTASEVRAALVQAVPSLISIANAGSDDGSGVVTSMALTALTGGSLQTTPPSQVNGDATNDHYFTGNDGLVFLEVVSSDAGAQTVSIDYAPTYAPIVDIPAQVESIPAGATRLLGPFAPTAFDQNPDGDVYFDPSVSTTLKFRAYKTVLAV